MWKDGLKEKYHEKLLEEETEKGNACGTDEQ